MARTKVKPEQQIETQRSACTRRRPVSCRTALMSAEVNLPSGVNTDVGNGLEKGCLAAVLPSAAPSTPCRSKTSCDQKGGERVHLNFNCHRCERSTTYGAAREAVTKAPGVALERTKVKPEQLIEK